MIGEHQGSSDTTEYLYNPYLLSLIIRSRHKKDYQPPDSNLGMHGKLLQVFQQMLGTSSIKLFWEQVWQYVLHQPVASSSRNN